MYRLEANLRMKRGEFVESIALLQKILTEYGEDIPADDAYFLQGEIYERQLHKQGKSHGDLPRISKQISLKCSTPPKPAKDTACSAATLSARNKPQFWQLGFQTPKKLYNNFSGF